MERKLLVRYHSRLLISAHSPDAGVPVMVRSGQTEPVEAQDTICSECMGYLDYSNPTNGAVDLANTYDKVTLYYFEDPAEGAGQVFY